MICATFKKMLRELGILKGNVLITPEGLVLHENFYKVIPGCRCAYANNNNSMFLVLDDEDTKHEIRYVPNLNEEYHITLVESDDPFNIVNIFPYLSFIVMSTEKGISHIFDSDLKLVSRDKVRLLNDIVGITGDGTYGISKDNTIRMIRSEAYVSGYTDCCWWSINNVMTMTETHTLDEYVDDAYYVNRNNFNYRILITLHNDKLRVTISGNVEKIKGKWLTAPFVICGVLYAINIEGKLIDLRCVWNSQNNYYRTLGYMSRESVIPPDNDYISRYEMTVGSNQNYLDPMSPIGLFHGMVVYKKTLIKGAHSVV